PPRSTLFPYTTLFRSSGVVRERVHHLHAYRLPGALRAGDLRSTTPSHGAVRRGRHSGKAPLLRIPLQGSPGGPRSDPPRGRLLPDRKSTRLNSSHVSI